MYTVAEETYGLMWTAIGTCFPNSQSFDLNYWKSIGSLSIMHNLHCGTNLPEEILNYNDCRHAALLLQYHSIMLMNDNLYVYACISSLRTE
jgi:hypothetical protein